MPEPRFSRDIRIAVRDRGMGRRDYGLIREEGGLLAELHGIHQVEGGNPSFDILPVVENAYLFAAAPDLYDACLKALPALEKAGARKEAAAIRAAMKKALPQE